jgi:hypothetical protein
MVDFLNSRNAYYYKNNNFVWSETNNCVTTTDNALAAAGFWKALPISAPLLGFGQVAIPLDSFGKWTARTHDLPIENPVVIYNDPVARKMLLNTGLLPLRPGVLTEYLPENQPNAIFSAKEAQKMISIPGVYGVTQSQFNPFVNDPRYTDLKTSLGSLEARVDLTRVCGIIKAQLSKGKQMQHSSVLTGFVYLLSLISAAASFAAAPPPPPPKEPNCQAVYNACTQAGYIYGDAGKGNGLYRDCITPLLTGTTPPKPTPAGISLPTQVSAQAKVCHQNHPHWAMH